MLNNNIFIYIILYSDAHDYLNVAVDGFFIIRHDVITVERTKDYEATRISRILFPPISKIDTIEYQKSVRSLTLSSQTQSPVYRLLDCRQMLPGLRMLALLCKY